MPEAAEQALCKLCGHDAPDPTGIHAIGCAAEKTRRHDALVQTLKNDLLTAGARPCLEASIDAAANITRASAAARDAARRALAAARPRAVDPSLARPSDIIVPAWPQRAGAACVPTGFDVVVASPYALVAMSNSRTGEPGAALAAAEERKVREARDSLRLIGVAFTPLAVTTNGRFSADTHAMLKELADRLERVRASGRELEYVIQRASVVIQGGNGALLAAFGRSLVAARALG